MDAAELAEWKAFFQLEPWGYRAQLIGAAIVSATVANYSGHAKKTLKPTDFLPREFEPKSSKDLYQMLRTWAQLNGAKKMER